MFGGDFEKNFFIGVCSSVCVHVTCTHHFSMCFHSVAIYFTRVMLSAVVCLIFVEVMTYISGLLTYSYFAECDPLKHPDPAQRVNSPNQVLLLLQTFKLGLNNTPWAILYMT